MEITTDTISKINTEVTLALATTKGKRESWAKFDARAQQAVAERLVAEFGADFTAQRGTATARYINGRQA